MAVSFDLLIRIGAEIRDFKKGMADAVQAARDGGKAVADATKTTDDAQQKLKDGLSSQARAVVDGASKFALLSTGARVAATGIGLAAAAALAYSVAAYKGAEEAARQADALLLTGNAAGLVSGQLNATAREVANQINGQTAQVRSIAETLTASGQVSAQALGSMSKAVALVARFSGQTREAVAKDFAGMADGVAKWAAKHNEQYHFITYAQYEYIKGLEDAGQKQRAMQETSELLSKHLGGDLTQNLGTVQRLWVSVGNAAKNAWDRFLDVGREKTAAEKVADAGEALRAAQARLETVKRTGQFAGGTGAQDALNKAQLLYELAVESQAAESKTAALKAVSAQREQAKFQWGALVEKSQSKQLQLQEAIAKATRTADEAGITDLAQRKQVIDHLTKQYLGSGTGKVSGLENQLNAELAVYEGYARERAAILASAEKSAESQRRQGVLNEQQLADQLHQIRDAALLDQIAIAEMQADTAGGKKQLAAQKRYQAEVDELHARRLANDQSHADRLREIDADQARRISDRSEEWAREGAAAEQALALELRLYGQTAEARAVALAGMKLEQEAERLIADAKKAGIPFSEQQAAAIRAEAAARGLNASAAAGERQAIEGAQQLRDANQRYAAESILDEEARARALLEIDANLWRQRIAMAGEGTEAQRRLIAEFDTWYQNQLDKPEQDRWRATVERFGTTFRDGFTRLLEGGKGKWKSFTGSLANTFETEVADQLYRLLAKPFVVNVIANLTAAGQAGQAAEVANSLAGGGGGGGLLGNLGTIGSLASGAGLLGAAGLGLQAGFGALVSGGLAGVGAAVSGGLAAIGTATGAGIAAGLGTIAGALGPIGIAAYAIYTLLNSKKGGPKTESTFDTGYASLARPGSDPTTARQVSESIETAYQQLATSLGMAVGDLEVGVFTAIDSAGDAMTQLQVVARQAGQEIYNRGARLGGDGTGATPGGIENVGRSEEELQAAVTAEVQHVLLAALLQSGLEQRYKDFLKDATDLNAAATTVAQVRQLDIALRNIGGPLANLTQLTVAAEVAAVNRLGGVQALNSYYQNFYTQAERNAATTARLTEEFTALGKEMPTTRLGLRQMIDAELELGEAGITTAARLISLETAFASVVPAADAAADAIGGTVATLQSVYGQFDSLADRFLTDSELRYYRVARIQQQLAAGGVNLTAEQISNTDVVGFRSLLADALNAGTQDGLNTASVLLSVADAFLELQPAAEQSLDSLRDYGRGLLDYVRGLRTGSMSPLSAQQRMGEASRQYQDTLAAARGGDAAARQRLQGVTDTFLSLAREYSPGSFGQVFNTVQADLSAFGNSLVNTAQTELEALQNLPAGIAEALAPLINGAGSRPGDIDAAYRAALGRPADAAGAAYYLQSGRTVAQIRQELSTSPEGQIAAAYRQQLGRDPDADGLAFYLAELQGGRKSMDQITKDLAYAKVHGSHADGLDRVPFDGYVMQAHVDEKLLSADNARRLDTLLDMAPVLGKFQSRGNDDALRPLVQELKALRQEVAQLRQQNNQGHAINAQATADNTKAVAGTIKETASRSAMQGRIAQRAVPT
ncbi:MAG TPA: phage tail length tape measure family protein [Burkholderiaceae bacterium]